MGTSILPSTLKRSNITMISCNDIKIEDALLSLDTSNIFIVLSQSQKFSLGSFIKTMDTYGRVEIVPTSYFEKKCVVI